MRMKISHIFPEIFRYALRAGGADRDGPRHPHGLFAAQDLGGRAAGGHLAGQGGHGDADDQRHYGECHRLPGDRRADLAAGEPDRAQDGQVSPPPPAGGGDEQAGDGREGEDAEQDPEQGGHGPDPADVQQVVRRLEPGDRERTARGKLRGQPAHRGLGIGARPQPDDQGVVGGDAHGGRGRCFNSSTVRVARVPSVS